MNKTSHPDFIQARTGVLISSKLSEFEQHRDRRSLGKKVLDLQRDVNDLHDRLARLEACAK